MQGPHRSPARQENTYSPHPHHPKVSVYFGCVSRSFRDRLGLGRPNELKRFSLNRPRAGGGSADGVSYGLLTVIQTEIHTECFMFILRNMHMVMGLRVGVPSSRNTTTPIPFQVGKSWPVFSPRPTRSEDLRTVRGLVFHDGGPRWAGFGDDHTNGNSL